jgi:ribokinase
VTAAAACLGYASLDHVVALNRPIEPGVTSLVARRHSPPAGRLGGCAANIAVGLVQEDVDVDLISWVGDDCEGERVLDNLQAGSVGVEGVVRDPERRTGVTWLSLAPSGESYCVYDPGGAPPAKLTDRQEERLAAARWMVVTVGPPDPCAQALDLLGESSRLLWAVKADPASFPPDLARRLAARADVIVHNQEETAFLGDALGKHWADLASPDALSVQTLGAGGVRYSRGATTDEVRLGEPIDVADSVGAGDRFCAGLLARLIDELDPLEAIRAGIESARSLLRIRRNHELAH